MKKTVFSNVAGPRKFARNSLAVAVSASTLLVSNQLAAQGPMLEEVVVTATRRAESVQDIPYNISAVSGDSLQDVGVSNVTDLVRMIPGLTAADVGGDSSVNNNLIIRGMNAQNPGRANILPNIQESAVSTYVNDTPVFFNLQLVDLQRVEVLRGPQGTLFGSGSVGGTVRFLLNDPDPSEATGSVEVGVGQTSHSDDLNYNAQFIGNLPLGESFAARVAIGTETLAGVTDALAISVLDENGVVVPEGGDRVGGDHTQTSKDDTDERQVDFFKGALLWDMTDSAQAVLTYLYQNSESDSDTYMRITDGDKKGEPWEHSRRFITPGEAELQLASLEIDADLGFASFSSSTSYSETDVTATNDISALYEELDDAFGAYAGAPRLAALTEVNGEFEGITQEFRLVSTGDGNWDWVVGAYYSDTESSSSVRDTDHSFEDWLAAVDLGDGYTLQDEWNTFSDRSPPLDLAYYVQDREIQFEDMALFGELTWHITETLQTTFGARAFWQEFESKDFVALPFCGVFCSNDGEDLRGVATDTSSDADFDDQIFKFNVSYDVSDDTMVYFTWSEGFRHGGSNSLPLAGFAAVDPSLIVFEADEATNWEVGIKGDIGDNIRYTLAGYFIEWESIQLDTFVGALLLPAVVNGNDAESTGVELEVESQITDNLSINFGLGYTDAELTEDLEIDGHIAEKGDPLPGVPGLQASVNANYYQSLGDSGELQYNLNASYRDDVETGFNEDFPDYADLDSFSLWNASVTWRNDSFSVRAYVDNITDEEALTGVQNARAPYSDVGFVGRPRTYGLKLGYDF